MQARLSYWQTLRTKLVLGLVSFPALACFLPFEPFLDGLEYPLATDIGHQLLSIVSSKNLLL